MSPLTPDHVNPERPWPNLTTLAEITAESGYVLAERITAQPPYVLDAEKWIDGGLMKYVAAVSNPVTGLAAAGSTASQLSLNR